MFVTPTLAFSRDVVCYFLRGWVFVFCFAFCSCLAFHLMSSFALHRHHFHKTCIRSLLPLLASLHCVRWPFRDQPHTCTLWSYLSLHSAQTPHTRPKVVPNPTRYVMTDGSGSSPNIPKTFPFSYLDSLPIYFLAARSRSKDPNHPPFVYI